MLTETGIDSGQVSEALQRVLRSRTFARSERLRSFLKFIVEMEQLGLSHQLKGYTIGIDVFSRNHGFDPGTDPLVRVQAGKLRKLLNQFYADEGRDDPLRIRIPLGGYVPVYDRVASSADISHGRDLDLIETTFAEVENPALAGDRASLPRLFIRRPDGDDLIASIFVNATRLWSTRLWAVCIAGPNEKPSFEGGAPHPLHFELKAHCLGTTLKLGLRHLRSGSEVPISMSVCETDGDSLEIGAFANGFAGANLTLPGSIYRFCHKNELSTGQMKCLDATYRYTLERTDETYISARRSQQQWAGLAQSSEIITEMTRLIALSSPLR
ncbi:hypothetical protein QWE_10087 [Agrobacterium albertimagni AOL15]|uniref:Adenylate cyclase n=1 Tax=Agrobacterium albertimagni AOL15 TaxID=1156935 RepID=K2Q773_9HYPH|nr:hypothetical protein [Agrobacterium albertimagni]EKF59564.1 hypothetical protein QWE_10087 [Agrobacterium albertimagni AOL15]